MWPSSCARINALDRPSSLHSAVSGVVMLGVMPVEGAGALGIADSRHRGVPARPAYVQPGPVITQLSQHICKSYFLIQV